jgi:hypothetical protein
VVGFLRMGLIGEAAKSSGYRLARWRTAMLVPADLLKTPAKIAKLGSSPPVLAF